MIIVCCDSYPDPTGRKKRVGLHVVPTCFLFGITRPIRGPKPDREGAFYPHLQTGDICHLKLPGSRGKIPGRNENRTVIEKQYSTRAILNVKHRAVYVNLSMFPSTICTFVEVAAIKGSDRSG